MDYSITFQAQNQYEALSESPLYEDLTLQRISSLTKSIVDTSRSSLQMNFQQFLHLQLKIEKARQTLLKVNLAITQCHQFFYLENKEIISHQLQTSSQMTQKDTENLFCQVIYINKHKHEQAIRQQWITQSLYNLQLFKKTLTIRQLQLSMILFIIEYRANDNFEQNYMKIYGQLMPFMIRCEDCYKKINSSILQGLFQLEEQFLYVYEKEVRSLIKFQEFIKNYNELSFSQILTAKYQNILNKIKIANSKIKTISQIFPQACIKDSEDLFTFNKSHERWQTLLKKDVIKYEYLSDKSSLKKNFEDLKQNLNVVNATMSIIDRYKLENNKSLNHNIKVLYERSMKILKCAIFKEEALFQAEIMFSEPKGELAKEIWNLPQHKGFRQFIDLCLPSIQYSQLMYIPRIYKGYFNDQLQGKLAVLPQLSNLNIYDELLQKKSYQQTIRVRVNFSKQLLFKKERIQQKSSLLGKLPLGVGNFISSVSTLFKKQQKTPKALIFHIHGGGFISMSSFIHQIYIRKWANQLNVPIISVDYGKAPQRPFPQGLYDCFQAYMWAILRFTQIFEVQPERIILVGDSAGGNLVASLTNLLIRCNLPLPYGIVLVYPALNLNLANYTPSFLTALNDSILPHTFLKICAKSYLSNHTQTILKNNDLISPIYASKQILAKYPRTYIYVGSKDPFHDDCCRFAQLLSENGQNKCELVILDEFPHGFLQFDLKLMSNQFSRIATNLVMRTLESLLN